MNTMTAPEWETASFFSFAKGMIPIFAIVGAIFFLGNYVAQNVLDAASYSALSANLGVGMNYFMIVFLGLMTLLSSTSIAVAIFERIYIKRPWTFVARIATTGIVVTTAFGWTFIHMVRGDLGQAMAKLIGFFAA